MLTAGNLATTQAVIAQLKRDIKESKETNLSNAPILGDAAGYLGQLIREEIRQACGRGGRAGFSAEVTFILGGQVGNHKHEIYLIYPQGNYITSSDQTPFLQIGESKYGKAILDRIITSTTSLDDDARCALVSLDSTMHSNATVGPPIELIRYRRHSLNLQDYLFLSEDDAYLLDVRRMWNEQLTEAFNALPHIEWKRPPPRLPDA